MADNFSAKTYSTILADMESWIIAHQDKITDFNQGAITTSFCEAVAQEIEQVYIRTKIGFINYLPDLPFYAFGFQRLLAVADSGNVIFHTNTAPSSNINIPIGTLVSTPSGLLYATTSVGTILSGQTASGSIPILAQTKGAGYNVPATSVTVISTPIVGIDTVSNASAITGGLDQESDAIFMARFQTYTLGLGQGNTYGLRNAAMQVRNISGDSVVAASVIEHFPPITPYFYNVSLYISNAAGTASSALIEAVRSVIWGDGTAANPGCKPAGINVEVLAPTVITVAVAVTISATIAVDRTLITSNVTAAISGYINSLSLGQDVIVNELIEVIMNVAGVYDLSLTNPPSNILVGDSQVARTVSIAITYS